MIVVMSVLSVLVLLIRVCEKLTRTYEIFGRQATGDIYVALSFRITHRCICAHTCVVANRETDARNISSRCNV